MNRILNRSPFLVPLSLLALAGPISSCTQTGLLSLVAPSADFAPPGGSPVPRTIFVGFINNTPFRAIFSFGAYAPLDQEALPTGFGQLRLEGNTASAQIAQPCRPHFSVGGDELIRLLEKNQNDPAINITDDDALVRGVNFSGAPLGDPLEAAPTEGSAAGTVLLNGVDFGCERTDIRDRSGTGLLIFTFVQDAASPGGFRIDYMFIRP